MRMAYHMEKPIIVFLALCAAAFSLTAGEIPLTADNFVLGKHTAGKTGYDVSFRNDVLTVVVQPTPNIGNTTCGAILNLPPEKLIGMGVRFRGEIRHENIASDAGGPFWGAKILASKFRQGVYNFFCTPVMHGTQQEWQPVSLECDFPEDQQSAHVVFGIQQGWGKVEFRNLVYETFPVAPLAPVTVPEGFKCEYTARVTGDVPHRGVMSPAWRNLTAQDIHDLGAWKVNLLRYQIVGGCPDPADTVHYRKWFNEALDHLDTLLPLLRKYGIKVIIDMHLVAGGRYGKTAIAAGTDSSHFRAMHEESYRRTFIEIWQETARRFRGNPQIYAFDLCNEPIQHGKVPYSFWELQYDAAKSIRDIDPEVPVMVESNHMASPVFFEMAPMPLSNIIYSVHMYAPGEYTHQGVNDPTYIKTFYSMRFDWRKAGWNRARLAATMQVVRDFQLKYGAKIQVGEFSVAVWAPGGADYLNDLVSIFEEYRWDWTYHAFREWEGWSLEHEGTPDHIRKAQQDTDRKQVMLRYFKLNQKQSP